MVKAKPVKKGAASQPPPKISTSLFQRKSKTSQGAGTLEMPTAGSSKKGAAAKGANTPKGKQAAKGSAAAVKTPAKGTPKGKEAASTSTPKRTPKQQQPPAKTAAKTKEKPSSSSAEPKGAAKRQEKTVSIAKKGKAGKAAAAPAKGVKGKAVSTKKRFFSSSSSASSSIVSPSSSDGESKSTRKSAAAAAAQKKGSTDEKRRKSREVSIDKSPSPSTRLRSPESDKVTTRKRSKSDSESPPPQKVAKVGSRAALKNKRAALKKGVAPPSTKEVAKRVAKKVVAAKQRTIVRKPVTKASSASSSASTSSTASSSKAKETFSKGKKKTEISSNKGGLAKGKKLGTKAVKVKPKAKMKPKKKSKSKRMASLNAKAILEASFSYENEKKRGSPAPQSSSTPQGAATPPSTSSTSPSKVKTSAATSSSSTSTSETTTKGAKSEGSGTSDLKSSTVPSSSSSSSIKTEPKSKNAAAAPPPPHVSSVSTSTSPTPPEMLETLSTSAPASSSSSSLFKKTPVTVKSEKKARKSTDDSSSRAGGSRRESVSSHKSSGSGKDSKHSTSSSAAAGTQTSGESSSSSAVVKKEKAAKETGKGGSRRASSASTPANNNSTTSEVGTSTEKKEKAGAGGGKQSSGTTTVVKKKHQKAVMSTTSTSTSTSPIPKWTSDCDEVVVEKRPVLPPANAATTNTPANNTAALPKQKKNRSNSSGGRDKVQDSSQTQAGQVSSHHHSTSYSSAKHKGASYQAKEKSSSSPVALYGSGTVYQPAGPLIEPHKQTAMPAGIIPDTVRLPPDLKVTYQAHPPSSAFMVSPTAESQQQQSHHHHHHHHHSSSTTSKSSGSSSSKSHKSSASGKASEKGSSSSSSSTILHQPYKSTTSSSSSPALSRNVPSTFSSTGSGYASSSAGTPLLSPNDASHHHHHHPPQQSPSVASGGSASAIHGSQISGSSMSAHHHPLHSVTPGGSISANQQPPNSGAPSSSGLFYTTTNYGPHHSPFATCKYPLGVPEQYRTQSPFPNSFLCPPTTPQPSQNYFMTPFYTPPLTPNPTPGGIATVGPSQARALPLSTAASHQAAAAAAAAAAYYQPGGPLSQPPSAAAAAAAVAAAAGHLPNAGYYMPSPQHHSIHPSAAPGHAGPFRPNQSSQPACPFPTDSFPPSSSCTSISNTRPPPLQQRPSPSSGSLAAPEAGAKHPKPSAKQSASSPILVSVTASRPSRNGKEPPHLHHPPACVTPALAADPPSAIQIIPTSDAQTRQQLESAKTFTEQYSLPDDITITPILPPNTLAANPALLMLNSSVSVILTSAPTSTTSTVTTSTSRSSDGLLKSNNSNLPHGKPKEKDIVHVIDPRSGQRTTIAKHMSNNSRIAQDLSKASAHNNRQDAKFGGGMAQQQQQQRTPHSRMETVRKLNPDLDVIVINNNSGGIGGTMENRVSPASTTLPDKPPRNMTNHQGNPLKALPPLKAGGRMAPNKTHPVPFSTISSSVMGLPPPPPIVSHNPVPVGKRMALGHNDNNFHRTTGNGAGAEPGSLLRVNRNKKPKQPRNNNNNNNNAHLPNLTPSPSSYHHNHHQANATSTSFGGYTMPVLPPGISISAGSSSGAQDLQPTNLSKKTYRNINNNTPIDYRQQPAQQMPVQPQQRNVKAIKRSLNECIDGLQLQQQQKKLKMLEQQHALSNGRGGGHHNFGSPATSTSSARTGIYNVNGGKPIFSGGNMTMAQQQQLLHQAQLRQQQLAATNYSKGRQQFSGLPSGMFVHDTATAARVRGPDFEQKMGGMLINSNDAMTAVSALVVEPFDYSLAGRKMAYNAHALANSHSIGRGGRQNSRGMGRPLTAYAIEQAKKKVNKFKGRTHVVPERGGVSSGRGGGAGSKSKIRTRLSVKPKGLHNSNQPLGSRSRSRLLRKRSLLCTPNAGPGGAGRNKSESDGGSVCASRSSSSVRIIAGGAQNGKVGKDRGDKDKPRHTQAFINASADLYQYRRRLILRVPSPKPGQPTSNNNNAIMAGANTAAANLNRSISAIGADAIARFGEVSSSSSSPEVSTTTGSERSEIPREVAAHQMAQLARSHIMGHQHQQNQPLPVVSSQQYAVQESKGPTFPLPRTGSMVVNALKKRAGMKPLSPASVNGALNQQLLLNVRRQPRWSNGWTFEGEPYEGKVYVKNDDMPVTRRCYPSMRHDGGDVIRTRDCVLLKSGPRKNDLPFIAKIAALWENPGDGEMMFSLLWYYRPEHTELGRTKDDMMDEIFASKHRDTNSVATIEDRCYVLTFNEYCRYRKRLKQLEQGIQDASMVPFADTAVVNTDTAAKIAEAVWNGISAGGDLPKGQTPSKVSPEVVFFCRKVYDFRQKRILKNPS